ncbi:iron dicitrate transporter FecR [Bacteroidales bacterium]|nr:iron dicitrate transporter FecR [Bacteroidales bacterium]
MDKNKHIQVLKRFLQGKTSLQETRLLLSQIDNESYWEQWTRLEWEASGDEMDEGVGNKVLKEINNSIKLTRVIRFRKIWNVAASILILCLLASTLLLLNERHASEMAKYSNDENTLVKVERGQRAALTLPDGSQVWLNSDSKMSYGKHFNALERRVELVGEAYFEVAQQANRPFIVSSDKLSIEALGTSFNVRAYADESFITAVLIEGLVEVSSSKEKIQLSPNEGIYYDRTKHMLEKKSIKNTRTLTAWKENRLSFENKKLSEITMQLSRQYNIGFKYMDESLKNYEYSGTVENTSLQSVLELFALTSPLAYEIKDNTIILYENREAKKYYKSIVR